MANISLPALQALVSQAVLARTGISFEASDLAWETLAEGQQKVVFGFFQLDPKTCGPMSQCFESITIQVSARRWIQEQDRLVIRYSYAWTMTSGGSNGEDVLQSILL